MNSGNGNKDITNISKKFNSNFFCFNSGRFISLLGTGMQATAIPLYILDVTGKGVLMGLFAIVTLVPMLAAVPFAGILGDRVNRKTVMVHSDFIRGLIIFILSLIAVVNKMNISILFAAQIFIAVTDSIFNAASSAILPELVDGEELMKANSLKGTTDGAANLLGPVLGGLLYGLVGIKAVFFINALSFFLSGIFEILICYKKTTIKKQPLSVGIFLKENGEVFEYIIRTKGLLQLFLFAMTANLLSVPIFSIVYPYIFRKIMFFSPQQYGYIEGFFTGGMLLANAAMVLRLSRISAKKLMKTGFTVTPILCIISSLFALPYILSRFAKGSNLLFMIIGVCYLATGFANAIVNTPFGTNLQKLVPDNMRSRFFALLGFFAQAAIPIGSGVYGILIDIVTPYKLLVSANLLFFIASMIFVIFASDDVYNPK